MLLERLGSEKTCGAQGNGLPSFMPWPPGGQQRWLQCRARTGCELVLLELQQLHATDGSLLSPELTEVPIAEPGERKPKDPDVLMMLQHVLGEGEHLLSQSRKELLIFPTLFFERALPVVLTLENTVLSMNRDFINPFGAFL